MAVPFVGFRTGGCGFSPWREGVTFAAMGSLHAMLMVIGLGVVYFIAAIPTGIGLQLPATTAAICAWIGYTGIAGVMLLAGAPIRRWMERRLAISPRPDPARLFWRVWLQWGLPGLALIAPVTCGPYLAALLGLALGERPGRLLGWIAAGAIPWCIVFAAVSSGVFRGLIGR